MSDPVTGFVPRRLDRSEDSEHNAGIAAMLKAGTTWSQIQAVGCSRAHIAKIAKTARLAIG